MLKFSCAKVSLLDKLTVVSSVVEGDIQGSVLSSVHMEAKPGEVVLTAISPQAAIRTSLEAEVTDEGSVLVPAKFFTSLVRVAAGNTLLVTREDTTVAIESGNSRLTSFTVVEPPTRQSFDCDYLIATLSGEALAEGLERAVTGIDRTKATISVWTGLRMRSDESFSIVGCDGTRAMRALVGLGENPYEAVIPQRTASILSRLAKRSEQVIVRGDQSRMLFEAAGFTLMSALIAGQYANIEAVLPTPEQVTTRVMLPLSECLSAMSRIKTLSARGDDSQTLYLAINRYGLAFSIASKAGDLRETLAVEVEGETLETVQFKPNYVYDIVPFVVSDPVVFGFCAHKANALYVEDGDWRYFAMPKGLPNT